MRRLFLLAAVLLVASIPAKAQNNPDYEVFGGYSYLNSKIFERDSLHGWGLSIAGNLGPKWGLVAEFSGHYGNAGFPSLPGSISFKKYTYLFGPRFSSRSDKATAFGHILVGGANSKFAGGSSFTGFALGAGGGVDVNVNKSVAVRVFQVDYLPDRSLGRWSHNVRAQVGLVFKFGQ